MTTVYSDNYTRLNNSKLGSPGAAGYGVLGILETYEAAALALGSTIYMARPPAGTKYAGGYLVSDNLGNNTTLAVGTSAQLDGTVANTTRFLSATNHGGGSAVLTSMEGAAYIDQFGYEFDGGTDVIITTGAGEGTGTIKLFMRLLRA